MKCEQYLDLTHIRTHRWLLLCLNGRHTYLSSAHHYVLILTKSSLRGNNCF